MFCPNMHRRFYTRCVFSALLWSKVCALRPETGEEQPQHSASAFTEHAGWTDDLGNAVRHVTDKVTSSVKSFISPGSGGVSLAGDTNEKVSESGLACSTKLSLQPDSRPDGSYFEGNDPRQLWNEHDTCEHSEAYAKNFCPSALPSEASSQTASTACVTRQPFVRDLGLRHQAQICSQLGQDGIIFEVFRHIKATPNRFFVEAGSRKPDQLNSAHLRVNCGWRGLLLDKFPNPQVRGYDLITKDLITPTNVNEVFAKNGVPRVFDLLTLDFDSNEYWVWKAMDESRFLPRVVSLEFNDQPHFSITDAATVESSNTRQWATSCATPQALWLLAKRKGYCLASVALWHIMFTYCSLLHPDDRNMTLQDLPFNPYNWRVSDHNREVSEEEEGLRFIDVTKDKKESTYLKQKPQERVVMTEISSKSSAEENTRAQPGAHFASATNTRLWSQSQQGLQDFAQPRAWSGHSGDHPGLDVELDAAEAAFLAELPVIYNVM